MTLRPTRSSRDGSKAITSALRRPVSAKSATSRLAHQSPFAIVLDPSFAAIFLRRQQTAPINGPARSI